jgi:hypothetical protein
LLLRYSGDRLVRMTVSLIITGILAIAGSLYGFARSGRPSGSPLFRLLQRTPFGRPAEDYQHWNFVGSVFLFVFGVLAIIVGVAA